MCYIDVTTFFFEYFEVVLCPFEDDTAVGRNIWYRNNNRSQWLFENSVVTMRDVYSTVSSLIGAELFLRAIENY